MDCVPKKLYEDALEQLKEEKKKLREALLDRNRLKTRLEYHEKQNKARQNGDGLSKAAEDRIIRRRLQSEDKLSEAQLDIWLNNQKRSSKWSSKGILQLTLTFFNSYTSLSKCSVAQLGNVTLKKGS